MKFRKKPVVIEAVQLTWGNWSEICDFVPKSAFVRGVWLDNDGYILPEFYTNVRAPGNTAIGLLIKTLEGEMLARGGDWIIKGVAGEFYPCKPDIFAATYEPVEITPLLMVGPGGDIHERCPDCRGECSPYASPTRRLDSGYCGQCGDSIPECKCRKSEHALGKMGL